MKTRRETILWKLTERVKELSALHQTSRILDNDRLPIHSTMGLVLELIPPAWQYPEITSARIVYGRRCFQTPDFSSTPWIQQAFFQTRDGRRGTIEVFYREEKPGMDEGPFLKEERELIDSLGQMLQAYLDRKLYRRKILRNRLRLETLVRQRTQELEAVNQKLARENDDRKRWQKKNRRYKFTLQKLVMQLAVSESRERRKIAEDIHDHIGQALAFCKALVRELQENAMFSGLEGQIEKIQVLLNQTILYTRGLSFEISVPILYELGLHPALEWLVEHFWKKFQLKIQYSSVGVPVPLPEDSQSILFRGTRELLLNIIKHAAVKSGELRVIWRQDSILIQVSDHGAGFSPSIVSERVLKNQSFGLFNFKERIRQMGGSLKIESGPGRGTKVTAQIPIGEMTHAAE